MIRIVFVTDSLIVGGIELQLVELVKRLDRSLYEPHVACLYGSPSSPSPLVAILQASNIPIHWLELRLTPQAKLVGMVRLVRLMHLLRPQIVQAENYHSNLLMRLGRFFVPSIKLLGTVRGVYSTKQLFYERISWRQCDYIVTNAVHLNRMLEQRSHIPPNRLLHIPNGIDLERFATHQGTDLRKKLLPDAHCVFLTIGRIAAEKNIHLTVKAFGLLRRQGRLLSGTHLIIVGPVQETEAQEQIDQAIAEDQLHDVVMQRPASLQVEDYYHMCDVCIVFSSPSRPPAEGLPSVILEALAAQRPVIVSETANAAEVIVQERNGWIVQTHNIIELASLIERISAAPDLLLAMRPQCWVSVQPFAVERMVDAYHLLYQKCLVSS